MVISVAYILIFLGNIVTRTALSLLYFCVLPGEEVQMYKGILSFKELLLTEIY